MPRNKTGGGAPVGAVYALRKFAMFGPLRPLGRAYVDALVHSSARSDPLAAARHRVFIATRLIGVLIAFAFLPVLLVLVAAPPPHPRSRARSPSAFGPPLASAGCLQRFLHLRRSICSACFRPRVSPP